MRHHHVASLSLVILLAAGCGKPAAPAPAASAPGSEPAPAHAHGTAPAPGATPPKPKPGNIPIELDGATQVVRLTGDDAMKYNGSSFIVRAGQPVRLELTNIGRQPPELMGHNVVVLKAGADAQAYNFAAVLAKATDYLPPELADQVVAATAMAGRGQTVKVEFTAPAPGEYPFLCTFPAHYLAGMRGTMTVAP